MRCGIVMWNTIKVISDSMQCYIFNDTLCKNKFISKINVNQGQRYKSQCKYH
jgi:hypothetical protein